MLHKLGLDIFCWRYFAPTDLSSDNLHKKKKKRSILCVSYCSNAFWSKLGEVWAVFGHNKTRFWLAAAWCQTSERLCRSSVCSVIQIRMNEVKLNGNSFCLSEEVIRIYWPILAGPSLQFRLFIFVLVQEFKARQPTHIIYRWLSNKNGLYENWGRCTNGLAAVMKHSLVWLNVHMLAFADSGVTPSLGWMVSAWLTGHCFGAQWCCVIAAGLMVLGFLRGVVRRQPVQAIREMATHLAPRFNGQYGG